MDEYFLDRFYNFLPFGPPESLACAQDHYCNNFGSFVNLLVVHELR